MGEDGNNIRVTAPLLSLEGGLTSRESRGDFPGVAVLVRSILDGRGQPRRECSEYSSTLSRCKWAAGAHASPAVTCLSGFSLLIFSLSARDISLSALGAGLPVPWVQRGQLAPQEAVCQRTLPAPVSRWYSHSWC